jgi:hypothetical protein
MGPPVVNAATSFLWTGPEPALKKSKVCSRRPAGRNFFYKSISNSGSLTKIDSSRFDSDGGRLFELGHSRASSACHSVSDSVEIAPFWIAQFRKPAGAFLIPNTFASFIPSIFCHFVLRKSELRKSAFARFAPSKSAPLRFALVRSASCKVAFSKSAF